MRNLSLAEFAGQFSGIQYLILSLNLSSLDDFLTSNGILFHILTKDTVPIPYLTVPTLHDLNLL